MAVGVTLLESVHQEARVVQWTSRRVSDPSRSPSTKIERRGGLARPIQVT